MNQSPTGPLRESLSRFTGILTSQEINQILEIQEHRLPTGIRLNPLKVDPSQQIKELVERYQWQVDPISFTPHGWTITNAEQAPGGTIEHRMGLYYIQDAASMVPASLFCINETHPLILDLAASPGGKTTHLIDRTRDQGFILANDASRGRIPALRSVLTTWGGINQVITQFPGEAFGSWYPETFDLILLDAPCSMENLRPTPSHPLRRTTHDERSRLQQRQVQLLSSALKALKIGGQLVYATCSLAPEEDEAVIDALYQTVPGKFSILSSAKMIEHASAGLTQFQDETFHTDLENAIRLWPHKTGMSGFFCSRLEKIGPVASSPSTPPSRDLNLTGLQKVNQRIRQNVIDHFREQYGFDLGKTIETYQLELFQRTDQIFLIPVRYLERFISLPFEHIGMALGRWRQDQLEPSHEFMIRFGAHFKRGILQIDEDQIPIWTAGRDIRRPKVEISAKGQYLLITDPSDRILGLGKLLPKRIRNMLPRGSF